MANTKSELAFKLTAAFIHWPGIRDMVAYEKFRGADIRMFESSGWLTRDFEIRGDYDAVVRIKRQIREFEEGRGR